MDSETRHFDGGCTCRQVRCRLTNAPLFVHGCHCRWCRRETASAPAGTPAVAEFYKASEPWPPDSLQRRAALMARRPA